jgi:MFS family permease
MVTLLVLQEGGRKVPDSGHAGLGVALHLFRRGKQHLAGLVALPRHRFAWNLLRLFFVTGQVYVDQKAPVALRAAAQGLIYFITYGIGMFVGSWICGRVVDYYAKSSPAGCRSQLASIWMVPAIASFPVLLFFWAGFKVGEKKSARLRKFPVRSEQSAAERRPTASRAAAATSCDACILMICSLACA